MPPDDTDRFAEPVPSLLGSGASGAKRDSATSNEADGVPIVYPIQRLLCRRCGETAEPVAGQCPWCGNQLGAAPRGRPRRPPRARPVRAPGDEYEGRRPPRPEYAIPVRRPYLIPPLVVVPVAYFGLLASLVGCAVLVALGGMTEGDDLIAGQAFAEVVTTGLTLLALGLVWKAARQKVPEGTAALTWAASFPLLCLLLVLNLAFFTLLRELLKPLGAPEPERMKLTLITVLLICVQPGIVGGAVFPPNDARRAAKIVERSLGDLAHRRGVRRCAPREHPRNAVPVPGWRVPWIRPRVRRTAAGRTPALLAQPCGRRLRRVPTVRLRSRN